MIELYAITDHPGPPLPEIAPLSVVASRGLGAVCAPAEDSSLSPEELWRHEEVVEALMEDRDLLPVRYGTRLGDEEAAARALEERHSQLVRALDRVRGAVELSVRVMAVGEQAEEPGPDDAVSGIEYLRSKARRAAAQAAVAEAVHEPLSGAARLSVRRPSRAASELLRGAYLVNRDEVARFASLVGELQEANPRLRLLCTGPWPPYSFTDDE